jgi:hypothetical protein
VVCGVKIDIWWCSRQRKCISLRSTLATDSCKDAGTTGAAGASACTHCPLYSQVSGAVRVQVMGATGERYV